MSISRLETRWRWVDRLGRFENSGLTIAAFCQQERISTASRSGSRENCWSMWPAWVRAG